MLLIDCFSNKRCAAFNLVCISTCLELEISEHCSSVPSKRNSIARDQMVPEGVCSPEHLIRLSIREDLIFMKE